MSNLSSARDSMKKFLIIGNKNAVTYKEIFPLIKDNQVWIGSTPMGTDMLFVVPDAYASELSSKREGSAYRIVNGIVMGRAQSCWFTNLEHNKRYEPLDLYKKYTTEEYPHYDNYDAIEVSKTSDIPMDYDGVMGVPITFLDKYCPEQFEIVGHEHDLNGNSGDGIAQFIVNGKGVYKRILIRKK